MSFFSNISGWFRKQPALPSMDGEHSVQDVNIPIAPPVSHDSGMGTDDRAQLRDENRNDDAVQQLMFDTPEVSSTPAVRARVYSDTIDGQNRGKSHLLKREREPAKFNGKGDWQDYLSHFTAVAKWNDWLYDDMGLQLAMSLTDEAREVMSSLQGSEKHDYNALVDAMTRRYSPEGRECQYSLELMNRTIRPGEDVTSYGHALRRLAYKAYPNQQIDEKMLVDMFIKGLTNIEMKRHVYLAKPRNLAEAVNTAVAYDAFDRPNSDGSRKPRITIAPVQGKNNLKQYSPQGGDGPDPGAGGAAVRLTNVSSDSQELANTVKQLQDELAAMRRQNEQSRTGRNRGNARGACFVCHVYGHYARECPERNQRYSQGNPNGSGQGHQGSGTQASN